MSTDTPPTSTPIRKFMFDRSFDEADVVHRAAERKPVLLKPEQVDALKKESYDAGFTAGTKAGKEEQIDRQNMTLEAIERHVETLIHNLGHIVQEQEEHTRHIAVAIVKKILPSFAAQHSFEEIEALFLDTIREMKREPRLVIRVHNEEFEVLDERLQAIATQHAFSGKVIVIADDDVAAGDCRIEWTDGGIERNTPLAMETIEETITPSS